ncbi:MAG TPA: ABC transporter substrate-binding protein [Steroidobacteraceae bacterium]|jgi:phospholipid transport system substrate-binding protein|nr:ABC transporter substrate-binding protein [Steroidobacteraceae bacterium]
MHSRTATRAWVGAIAGVLLGSAAAAYPAAAAAPASGGASVTASSAGPVDSASPYALVKSAASTLLQDLDQHRAEYRQDPAKLRMLVDQVLLPHFDTELAARAVLGQNWKKATPDQRQHFIQAFYNSLLNNYGSALLGFTSNTMEVLPFRAEPGSAYAAVNTRIRRSNGSQVAVNYQVHNDGQQWKVWDVVVEGISYDKSFQQDFSEQIQRQGIDAVITRLEHGETPAAIKQTTGG